MTVAEAPQITQYFPAEVYAARPRERMSGSEWAAKYRILTSVTSSVTGKWQNETFALATGVLDAITHENVLRVSWASGTQNAKTETILNTAGYFMHQSPAPMMLTMPEKSDCSYMSKIRIAEMINNTSEDVLAKCCDSEDIRRDKFMIPFTGGVFYIAWATSVNQLASKPVAIILMDEVDKWKVIPKHGDPQTLLLERIKAQINAKVLEAGSPVLKDGRILTSVKQADFIFDRYAPCPHCEEGIVFTFGGLHVKDGVVSYECPHCGELLKDRDKPGMLTKALWKTEDRRELYDVLENGGRNLHLGFRSSSFYSPFISFTDIWDKSQSVAGDIEKKRAFVNGWLGLGYDELDEVTLTETSDLLARAKDEDFEKLPPQVCLLTAGVDVQKTRIEALVMGWGLNYENWVIERKIISGDPRLKHVWDELYSYLRLSRFPHFCGANLRLSCVAVDAGYLTQEVTAYLKGKEKYRIYCIKGGSEGEGEPMLKNSVLGAAKAQGFLLGTFVLKDTVKEYMQASPGNVGYMHFRESVCDEDYFLQLTAEECITEIRGGKAHQKWVKVRNRNEVFDLTCYNIAALHIMGAPLQAYHNRILAQMGGSMPSKEPAPAKPKPNAEKPIPKEEKKKPKIVINIKG
ncbi:terminase gpA endonuclease subunit [Geovibrio ferrireducens]|uniref:terminase gpA endonuclease subunit n=1 Tax=Geovibrio ferrireducens TaxID=46201 RepID=UPI00224534C8|nr:terminase gpA endonuclease subunit [Geovibrio ferrireducens]